MWSLLTLTPITMVDGFWRRSWKHWRVVFSHRLGLSWGHFQQKCLKLLRARQIPTKTMAKPWKTLPWQSIRASFQISVISPSDKLPHGRYDTLKNGLAKVQMQPPTVSRRARKVHKESSCSAKISLRKALILLRSQSKMFNTKKLLHVDLGNLL